MKITTSTFFLTLFVLTTVQVGVSQTGGKGVKGFKARQRDGDDDLQAALRAMLKKRAAEDPGLKERLNKNRFLGGDADAKKAAKNKLPTHFDVEAAYKNLAVFDVEAAYKNPANKHRGAKARSKPTARQLTGKKAPRKQLETVVEMEFGHDWFKGKKADAKAIALKERDQTIDDYLKEIEASAENAMRNRLVEEYREFRSGIAGKYLSRATRLKTWEEMADNMWEEMVAKYGREKDQFLSWFHAFLILMIGTYACNVGTKKNNKRDRDDDDDDDDDNVDRERRAFMPPTFRVSNYGIRG